MLILDNRCLSAVVDEIVRSARFPSIKARFVLPLVVLPSKDQGIFDPYKTLLTEQPRIPHRSSEVDSLRIRMPDVEYPPPVSSLPASC